MMRDRAMEGAALLEAVVALALGVALIGSLATALGGGIRWSRIVADRLEALEVVRTVWGVLDEELRVGLPGRDWRVDASGVLVLRAFRGVARVCGPSESGPGWNVSYRGRRDPDPGRDSVLVLGRDGRWRAFALEAVTASSGCSRASPGRVARWVWSRASGPRPLLARLYERGSYHLADRAFRYRSGEGGRQPLTHERLGPTSRFVETSSGVEVILGLADEDGPGGLSPFRWEVRGADAVD